MREKNCIACGEKMTDLRTGRQKCKNCGHWIFPHGNKKNVYIGNKEKLKYYCELEDKGMARQLSALRLAQLGLNHPSAIYDVGCAIGTFIQVANEERHYAQGGDISWEMVKEAGKRDRHVNQLNADEFISGGKFEAITMFDVIEHVKDPIKVLKNIKTHLYLGGKLLISTPNSEGVQHIKKWRHYKPGEHLHGFTAQSLDHALRAAGFTYILHNYLESEFRINKDQPDNIVTVLAHA